MQLYYQAPGSKPYRSATHRDHQVHDRDLAIAWGARPPQVRDLVATQDRPQEDVAETSFGQVHDLGEHRVLIECFLGAEMLLHELPEAFVRVTEPTEEPRPRWADEASQRDAEPAAVQRLFGGRGDRGHRRESPRQRRRLPDRHGLDVSRLEHDLLVAAAQSLAELANCPAKFAPFPIWRLSSSLT
jgi:hypothetical protein